MWRTIRFRKSFQTTETFIKFFSRSTVQCVGLVLAILTNAMYICVGVCENMCVDEHCVVNLLWVVCNRTVIHGIRAMWCIRYITPCFRNDLNDVGVSSFPFSQSHLSAIMFSSHLVLTKDTTHHNLVMCISICST